MNKVFHARKEFEIHSTFCTYDNVLLLIIPFSVFNELFLFSKRRKEKIQPKLILSL